MNTEGADRTADRLVPVELLEGEVDAADDSGDRLSSGRWPSLHQPPDPEPAAGSAEGESP